MSSWLWLLSSGRAWAWVIGLWRWASVRRGACLRVLAVPGANAVRGHGKVPTGGQLRYPLVAI